MKGNYNRILILLWIFVSCLLAENALGQNEYIARKVLYMKHLRSDDSSFQYDYNDGSLKYKILHQGDTLLNGVNVAKHHAYNNNRSTPLFQFYFGGNFIDKIAFLSPYIEYADCFGWNGTEYRKSLNQLMTKVNDTAYTQNCITYCRNVDSITYKVDYSIDRKNSRMIGRGYDLTTDGSFTKADSSIHFYTRYENDLAWYLDSIITYDLKEELIKIKTKRIIQYNAYAAKDYYYYNAPFGYDLSTLQSADYTWNTINSEPFIISGIYTNGKPSQKLYFSSYDNITLGLDNELISEKVTVYPTPATATLFIGGAKLMSSYEIADLRGKVLAHGELIENSIDIHALSSGVYFLKLNTSERMEILKFIKE